MAVDKRILFGSLGAAVIISVAGGYALSRSDDADGASADDDITIDATASFQEPSLGNQLVEGEPLPDVTIRDVAGNEITTSELLGQPLLINMWATTCAPCKEEMPALAAVHRQYGDRVRFIGLNQVANNETALDFAADKGVRYELLSDEDGQFAGALGITTLPYTLLVAPDGTIVAQKGIALSETEIREAVETYLLPLAGSP